MTNPRLPGFMSNPKKDECKQRLSAVMSSLRNETYTYEHISVGAATVSEQYIRQTDPQTCRRLLVQERDNAREKLKDLEPFYVTYCDSTFDQRERPPLQSSELFQMPAIVEDIDPCNRTPRIHPQRDQCIGRFAACAVELTRQGYEARHIAFAASEIAQEAALACAPENAFTILKSDLELAEENIVALDELMEEAS
ncbi:hypothetical protein [Caballeronia sp. TF1N1]|uniref:hypothetical protein n=1 Tax=Caballeronia sp. TF1N1 TaxID=2878153 RepID=UPI001FD5C1D6|nr:hypothetical protein [Caballeronia sp. TF1N1]